MNLDRLQQRTRPGQAERDEAHYRARLEASTVPEHLRDGLVEYFANHIPPGSFLRAVLSNDLLMAVKRGDAVSRASLSDVVLFLFDCAPIPSWGTEAKVAAWISGAKA